jgi:hypothetical protein
MRRLLRNYDFKSGRNPVGLPPRQEVLVTAYGQPWWRIFLVGLDDYRRAAARRGIDMHSMEARQAGDPPQPSDRWTRTCQRFFTYYYLNFVPDWIHSTPTANNPSLTTSGDQASKTTRRTPIKRTTPAVFFDGLKFNKELVDTDLSTKASTL